MRSRIVFMLVGILFFVSGIGSSPAAEENGAHLPDWVIDQIVQRDDAISVARMLGMRELMGKSLSEATHRPRRGRRDSDERGSELTLLATRRSPSTPVGAPGFDRRGPGHPAPDALLDSPISALPNLDEWRPGVATRPNDPRTVVAVYSGSPFTEALKQRCLVRRSLDGGRSWSDPTFLPFLDPASNCHNPSLAWSDDGKRLFVAYQTVTYNRQYLEPPTPDTYKYRSRRDDDIFVTYSQNGGRTWATPDVALKGDPWGATLTCSVATDQCVANELHPGTSYTWPGIALAAVRGAHDWVYVTATREIMLELDPEPIAIAFTRSTDNAWDWSAPELLDKGARASTGSPQVSVQGSKPAAGPGGAVLVTWYHSGMDGFLVGDFEIRVAHSPDHGATWSDPVVAASDGEEVNFYLGPADLYKQWWTAMFPDIVIDGQGRAHIVYTADPDREDLTAEEGDIRYVASPGGPYTDWSVPEDINDDGEDRAQGFPVITVREGRGRSILDVIWEDTRLAPELTEPAPPLSSNYLYDVFHSYMVVGAGDGWSANTRVSDESSVQIKLLPSGRPGLSANRFLVYGAWTDRRDAASMDDRDLDVYGSRIPPERGVRD